MDTLQIENILQQDPYTGPQFHGVFPSDYLPTPPHYGAYILNTDPSTHPGEHWLAVYCNENQVEYFDSFGKAPDQFIPYLQTFNLPIVYNDQRLQGLSTMCGQYCIFYLLHRCRGWSMMNITNLFGKKTRNNDMFINFYINKHYQLYEPLMEFF